MISFELKEASLKPKYIQIADAIISEIERGNLRLNDRLPSVNNISSKVSVSRETVFKALSYLSEKGIVKSANRQGYYVMKTDVSLSFRIFLLFDKLTPFKEKIYQSFIDTIGDAGEVDIFFHHHNMQIFRSLITENLQRYTHFVIVTFMREDCRDALNLIPAEKRMILDSYEPELAGTYSMVYQDFSNDIVTSLSGIKTLLKEKYNRLVTLAPRSLYHTKLVEEGLKEFSQKTGFPTKILPKFDANDFHAGDVYMTLSAYDRELVDVIKLSRSRGYEIGRDIGIISYNDTAVKEILEGGITVISTDFEQMGKTAAEILLNKTIQTISNPTKLILRKSL